MTSEHAEHPEQPGSGGPQDAVPSPEGSHAHDVEAPDDISGIDNLIEEGGPLEPQDFADETTEAPSDPLAAAQRESAEHLADLQRLQAEFLNYKRRIERDRDMVRENAVYAVLTPMLDVLDSIDRAREAGELEGGFKGVAEQLGRIVTNLGLTRFGEPGDPFDPNLHEALSHLGTDADVEVPTAKHVAKAGYRIGDRVVRAAQVIVVDPEG